MIIECPSCDSKFSLDAEALGEEGREVRCSQCQHVWHQLPVEGAGPTEPQTDAQEELDEALDQMTERLEAAEEESQAVEEIAEKREQEEIQQKMDELAAEIQSDEPNVVVEEDTPTVPEMPTMPEVPVTADPYITHKAAGLFAGLFAITLTLLLAGNGMIMKAFPSTILFYDVVGLYDGDPLQDYRLSNMVSEIRQDDDGQEYLYIEAQLANLANHDVPYPRMIAFVKDNENVLKEWPLDVNENDLRPGSRRPIKIGLQDLPQEAVSAHLKIAGDK